MNIAVFIKNTTLSSYYGGFETQNKVLCEGLVQKGHKVTVFSPKNKLDIDSADQNGVKYVFIPAVYRLGIFFEGIEGVASNLLSKLFKTKLEGVVSAKGKENWVKESVRIFKEHHIVNPFDIVLSQSAVGAGIIRYKKDLGVKVISIAHGTIVSEFKTRLLSEDALELITKPAKLLTLIRDVSFVLKNYFSRQREYILHANKVIAVSTVVKQSVIDETFISNNRVVVIHNGILPFEIAEKSDSPSVQLVFIARIDKSKGIFTLIEIMTSLDSSVRLNVIGDGPDLEQFKSYVSRLGLESRISILGKLSHEAAIKKMSESDIFVFPTQRIEGFPMTLPEAMFAGLPVVAFDMGGIKDAVENEKTGFLTSPGDIKDFVSKLSTLILDKNLRKQMGENGKLKAQREFSLDTMLTKYEQVINEVLTAGESR